MSIGQAESILKLDNILVEEIDFKRKQEEIDLSNLEFSIGQSLFTGEDGLAHKVSVIAEIKSIESDELYIKILMSGYFRLETSEDLDPEFKEILLRKNTMAILFPYMRSFITTITSQTGMKPIIIPTININALLEDALDYKEVEKED